METVTEGKKKKRKKGVSNTVYISSQWIPQNTPLIINIIKSKIENLTKVSEFKRKKKMLSINTRVLVLDLVAFKRNTHTHTKFYKTGVASSSSMSGGGVRVDKESRVCSDLLLIYLAVINKRYKAAYAWANRSPCSGDESRCDPGWALMSTSARFSPSLCFLYKALIYADLCFMCLWWTECDLNWRSM